MKRNHAEQRVRKVRVWDVPTRVFHWIFALAFAVAFATRGDARYLDTHVFAGYTFAGLLAFRVVWGLVGTSYARFQNFGFNPKKAFDYVQAMVKGPTPQFLGHNPAGSIAIYIMLITAALISISGLVVYAGVEQQGILYPMFTISQGAETLPYHERFAWALLVVAVLHVAAILFETIWLRERLVPAMLSGYKYTTRRLRNVPRYGYLASTIVFVVVIGALMNYKGYIQQTSDNPYLPYKPVSLPQNVTWNEECGDCHIPYHPSLLPQRSWITLLKQQQNHFDEDLALDQDLLEELRQFALKNSSERLMSETAWYVNTTTPLLETPLRVTETHYWKSQHENIKSVYWDNALINSKAQCEACHFDAKQGSFQDGAMRLPKLKPKSPLKVAMNHSTQ